jgi:hypothetical protein
MARKLDIFKLMDAMDRRDFMHFQSLPLDAQKEYAHGVIMRWVFSVEDKNADDYLIRFNERVNQCGDLLWSEPKLSYALMASVGSGRKHKHGYVAAPKKAPKNSVLHDFILINWPNVNDLEAQILIDQMDKKTFSGLLTGSSIPEDQQKKIASEYAKAKKARP